MSTYEPIISQTLSSNTPSVTFSSLPQNYTDLVLVISGQVSTASSFSMRVNGDSGSNYSSTLNYTDGTSAQGSVRVSNQTQIDYGTTNGIGITGSGVYTPIIVNIMNYANSATFKTFIGTNRTASGGYLGNGDITQAVSLYRSTNPITSITVFASNSANWITGSTFTIYGVAAGNSSAKASGGNIVTTDGTYWYHTFTSSGTFIPSTALTADYLVVAGGGGGGSRHAGGGGAGGYRTSIGGSALSLSANTLYQAIVGAGGIGGSSNSGFVNDVTPGNNSVFSTITSAGGGKGGGTNDVATAGGDGGSGGGGQNAGGGGSGNIPSTSPSQGNSGGGSVNGPVYGGGGGGGASATGATGNTSAGGNGGNGTANSISGTSITYAGGGGGGTFNGGTAGTGGTGGGGAGSTNGNKATAGTVNLGGGGGGGGSDSAPNAGGGNGGSGIIILRYAV